MQVLLQKLNWKLFVVLAIMACSSATILAQPSYAAPDWLQNDAETYCGIRYPSDDTKRQACTRGYADGSGTGETCDSVPSSAKDACMEGYNRKVSQQGKPGKPLSSNIAWACDRDSLSPEAQEACRDGYKNGIGDGSICAKYEDNADQLQACIDGYETLQSDIESCRETSLTEDACRGHLRAQAQNPSNNDSANPDSSPSAQDPSQKKGVGAFPTSGEIQPLITYKIACTESDPSKCAPQPCDNKASDACKRAGKLCKPNTDTGGNCDASSAEKCALEGFFGDMLCGTTRMLGSITDTSYSLLSTLLETDPVIQTSKGGGDSSMYTAWSVARGVANLFFVFTLLIVILSYTTNIGVSTYNIKRIAPRIITTAILVNASFWICALFVDISNIIGATIVDTLGSITSVNQITGNNLTSWQLIIESMLLASATAAAASITFIHGGFGVLAPFLVTTLIAVVTVFLMMLARQVLIILFIIVSPLAFVSLLLPGTSSLFEKWRKLFVPLLMLYPVVGLIFGLSKVASDLVVGVAANTDQTILAILGLGIQVAPLVMLPAIMSLGGKALSMVGDIKNSGVAKKQQDKAEAYAKHKKNQIKLNALSGDDPKAWQLRKRAIRSKSKREAKRENLDEEHQTAQGAAMRDAMGIGGNNIPEEGTDNTVSDTGDQVPGDETPDTEGQTPDGDEGQYNDELARRLAQTDDSTAQVKARNHFIQAKVSAIAKLAQAKRLELRNNNTSRDDLISMAQNKQGEASELTQDAAVLQIANSGDLGAILSLMKNAENMTFQQRRTLMRGVTASGVGGRVPFLGNPEIQDAFIRGDIGAANFSEAVVGKSLAEDDYSAQTLTELDKDAMDEVLAYGELVNNGSVAASGSLGTHANTAREAIVSKETQQKTSRNSEALKTIASWRDK